MKVNLLTKLSNKSSKLLARAINVRAMRFIEIDQMDPISSSDLSRKRMYLTSEKVVTYKDEEVKKPFL